MNTRPIRVLIVDDSALVREMLSAALSACDDIEVVGKATDPYHARDMIKKLRPDVLTLDVEMPKMDGIAFLRNLMKLRPMPVVMVSTTTAKGSENTLRALELGAVEYVGKPAVDLSGKTQFFEEVSAKVRIASKANIRPLIDKKTVLAKSTDVKPSPSHDHIVAIGASTGGTQAIRQILSDLPKFAPPIVIVEHIPPWFCGSHAARLDEISHSKVVQAQDNQPICSGFVYIAPGDHHLAIERSGKGYRCKLSSSQKVNLHRPSVEVLFDSVTDHVNGNAIGVLLTGLGADGAEGLLRMRQRGCFTIAQDEASSVIWGMPKAAIDMDAAVDVMALNDISARLLRHQRQPRTRLGGVKRGL
jgi:two-component system chemotaxis response regulator CheB